MGEMWFRNFTQIHMSSRFMTEEDMREILYPELELGIHIGFKLFEAGSIIGGFIVAPILPYIRPRGSIAKRALSVRMGMCGKRGMLIGILATPFMEKLFIQKKQLDEDGLKDRCYRLRYNKKQLLIDRSAFVGFLLGWGLARWPGMVLGTNVAVFAGTAYNAFLFDRMKDKRLLGGDHMETPDPNYKPKDL